MQKKNKIQIQQLTNAHDKSAGCRAIIGSLPEWFGQEESNRTYIEEMSDKDVFAAFDDSEIVALIGIKYHFNETAEIWWMGCLPAFQRSGIGGQLLLAAKDYVVQKGCRRMVVSTLSPRSTDKFYARTRPFYAKHGFVPLVEFNEGDPVNPMMWMITPLARTL